MSKYAKELAALDLELTAASLPGANIDRSLEAMEKEAAPTSLNLSLQRQARAVVAHSFGLGDTVAELERLAGIRAGTFDEGSRVPDGWNPGQVTPDLDATEDDEGSEIPDGSGNLERRADQTIRPGDLVLWDGLRVLVVDVHGYPVKKVSVRWTASGVPGSRDEVSGHKTVPVSQVQKIAKTAYLSPASGWSDLQRSWWKQVQNLMSARSFASLPADRGVLKAVKEIERSVYPDELQDYRNFWAKHTKRLIRYHEELRDWMFNDFDRDVDSRYANSGLYGHTKSVQADCESCIRKVQREARKIASSAYGRHAKVADFIQVHASRSESLAAKILASAMSELGPGVSRQARYEEGVSVDPTENMSPEDAAKWRQMHEEYGDKFKSSADKLASVLPSEPIKLAKVAEWLPEVPFAQVVKLAEILGVSGVAVYDGVHIRKATSKSASKGLYGFSEKVAKYGLQACSDLRSATGRIAYDLHRRREAKHGQITAFFDEHCKTAKCQYARLIHASYPDGPQGKKASAPTSVEDWLKLSL